MSYPFFFFTIELLSQRSIIAILIVGICNLAKNENCENAINLKCRLSRVGRLVYKIESGDNNVVTEHLGIYYNLGQVIN